MTHNQREVRDPGCHAHRKAIPRLLHVVIRSCIPGVLALAYVACTGDSALAPPTADIESQYWELRVNHPAVRLSLHAPHNTLQLDAVPLDAQRGRWAPAATSKIGPVLWGSSDSSKVHVSVSGRITALNETAQVFIWVRQQIDNVTRHDTVEVQVVDVSDPPVLKTFTARPTDSLKRGMGSILSFPVTALDEDGNPLPDLPVRWVLSNPKLATMQGNPGFGRMTATRRPGEVTFTAKTWVYGVSKTDTFTIQAGWNIVTPGAGGAISQVVSPSGEVVFTVYGGVSDIGPGGQVLWENRSGFGPKNVRGKSPRAGVAMDVVFDDPAVALPSLIASQNSGGGNILGIPGDTTLPANSRLRWRRFLTPGEYPYTIQPIGYRGVIVVHDR